MTYLCDANVISEPTKPSPSRRVVQRLRLNQSEWVINAMVAAEVWNGIAKLDAGQKKTDLTEWFAGLKANVT